MSSSTEHTTLLAPSGPTVNNRPMTRGHRSYTTGDLISQHNTRVARRRRQDSIASLMSLRSDSASVMASLKDFVVEHLWRPSKLTIRLVAAVLWALVAVVIFTLVFLPRTSLGRDYRRVHFSRLTRDDTRRLFLQDLRRRSANDTELDLQMLCHTSHLPEDGDGATQYVMDTLKSYGLDPQREFYYGWISQGTHVSLNMTLDGGLVYKPLLTERDPTTGEEYGAFHSYPTPGTVTRPYIYAHYGSIEDYALLHAYDIPTQGLIHIIRMGGPLTLAQKVALAEQNGAVAVITYTDPMDDGDITVANGYNEYPMGPARNPHSIERGSLLQTQRTPGDPTTPGFPSTRASRRGPPMTIPKIPAIPMSEVAITPILEGLDGGVSLNWTGGLPFGYSPGPSMYELSLELKTKEEIRPVKDIVYTIPGLLSDTIIVGAARDSTGVGASGAGSATATLLDVSKGFASLLQRGWRPLRTIIVASWDAEDVGMLGSTEFGEDRARDLMRHGIAYIDVGSVTGDEFEVNGHPLLDGLVQKTADMLHESPSRGTDKDFGSVFQHYLGIPSCHVGFEGTSHSAPVHHNSMFDQPDWIKRFVDPDLSTHKRLASFIGLLTIELSEHEVLSYSVMNYIIAMTESFKAIIDNVPGKWLTKTIKAGKHTMSVPLALQELLVSLESLEIAASEFDTLAKELQEEMTVDYAWFKFYIKLRLAFNSKILGNRARELEKLLTYKPGLKGRHWFKSVTVAPALYEERVEMLPGLAESVEYGDFDQFARWMYMMSHKVGVMKRKLRI